MMMTMTNDCCSGVSTLPPAVVSRRRLLGLVVTVVVLLSFPPVVVSLSTPAARATTLSSTIATTAPPKRPWVPTTVRRPELDQWRDFDCLRDTTLENEVLTRFYLTRPHLIACRLYQIGTTLVQAVKEWEEGAGQQKERFAMNYNMEDDDDETDNNNMSSSRGRRLCRRVSSLGPLSVKIGQTLSQRPDLVGAEAANALKRLQTQNVPFSNELAWCIVAESLGWDGPIAPGINIGNVNSTTRETTTLFASFSADPVAAASLGQVYRALLHDGREVAVKVQRPDGLSVLAADAQCFRLVLGWASSLDKLVQRTERFLGMPKRRGGARVSLTAQLSGIGPVIDRVAGDVVRELDYVLEAQNALVFEDSLKELCGGRITTPDPVPEYSTRKVLVTEWVRGRHLKDLDTLDEKRTLVRTAVDACTASLVLTGFVHADPHEGNLMLEDEPSHTAIEPTTTTSAITTTLATPQRRLVFLDFGLMSTVDGEVMESFARGIQACLTADWTNLVVAFKDSGFIDDPIRYRDTPNDEWRPFGVDPVTGEDLGMDAMREALGKAMTEVEGGTSRFGALATVLNQVLSPKWKMTTPPYVLLLIRTFLTLEGIAGVVDPDFNIYEVALPWAVRRSLSPATEAGLSALCSTLFEDEAATFTATATASEGPSRLRRRRRVREFRELLELVPQEDNVEDIQTTTTTAVATTTTTTMETPAPEQPKKSQGDARMDAVVELLGSRQDGRVLRRLLHELDSTDLVRRLVSQEAKELRRMISSTIGDKMVESAMAKTKTTTKRSWRRRSNALTPGVETKTTPSTLSSIERRRRRYIRHLVWSHLIRQFSPSPQQQQLLQQQGQGKRRRGPGCVLSGVQTLFHLFVHLPIRILLGAIRRAVWTTVFANRRFPLTRIRSRRRLSSEEQEEAQTQSCVVVRTDVGVPAVAIS